MPGSQPQPAVDIAVSPTNSPVLQSLIDQIAITGVAQIGNTVSVIVQEPGSVSGRHVRPGDMIAGGQVRIKSVDTSTPEPLVVLTYNGRDYTRTVGGSALIGSL
jgi:multidrug efflux pump subunit AcrA (membrane-fusion protein)